MRTSKKPVQTQVTPGKSRKSARRTPAKAGTLKIGTVSKKSGIPVVTLRFYEKMGLIMCVQNAETKLSAHRRFSPSILIQLDFIKLCRASGFSIPQIRSLMKLYRGFKVPSMVKMSALKRSIDLVRDQRSRLGQIEKVLLFRLRNPEGDIEDLLDD